MMIESMKRRFVVNKVFVVEISVFFSELFFLDNYKLFSQNLVQNLTLLTVFFFTTLIQVMKSKEVFIIDNGLRSESR